MYFAEGKRMYTAMAGADPLCIPEDEEWEEVYVSSQIDADCPITEQETTRKLRSGVTRFGLVTKKKWSAGILESNVQCLQEEVGGRRVEQWMYSGGVRWITRVGTRYMEVADVDGTGGMGMTARGKATAKGNMLEHVGRWTENLLTEYVNANRDCRKGE